MCIAAANRLVELTNNYNKNKPYSEKISMTCKRLQKLLYFSEAEYMKQNAGEAMFSEDFFAWPSGPVIPSVYSKFVQYQTGAMEKVGGEHTQITEAMEKVLDEIFERTKNLDTLDLVEKSHVNNGPWEAVFDANDNKHQQVITKKSIYEYYINHDVLA